MEWGEGKKGVKERPVEQGGEVSTEIEVGGVYFNYLLNNYIKVDFYYL